MADRAAMEATERLLGALGYTGMFCLDFVGAEVGGPLLVDLNPRVFGSWAALQRAGVDLVTAYMYAHDLHPTAPALNGARDGWWATAPFNGYLGKVGEAPTLDVAELRSFQRFLGWRWLTVRLLEVLMTR
jgi:hypothetical protein